MRGRRGIPGVIEDSLPAAALDKAQMSAKFGEMGEQVYVEAEKVKESNRVL
jgi:phosphomethylpyrimidine synthase